MSNNAEAVTSRLARLIGAQVARMISVAAELGIADLLVNGPPGCDELAARTEAHAPSVRCFPRWCRSTGLVAFHTGR